MIRKLKTGEEKYAGALMCLLWPRHTLEEMTLEAGQMLVSPGAAFYVWEEDGMDVGFAQCSLRTDYVEGTSTSPVGYLEGVYVKEAFRGRGIGRALIEQCMAFAKEMGCREFASDCELENADSLRFHLAVGFHEANRVICFARKLTED